MDELLPRHKIIVGIIGGSGLDDVAEHILQVQTSITGNFTTVFGKASSPVTKGFIDEIPVMLLSRHGHGHTISPSQVNYRSNIEHLKNLGCTHILATTACGSLRESINPGQLIVPDSFIDRTYLRKGTFFDHTAMEYPGVCHVPMEPAFDPRTSDILIQAGGELGVDIRKGGTIITIEGPRFSSKAESKAMQQWGGDLVNMTICPEVFLAKEAGILYAAVAMATDYDCWRDSNQHVCVADVMKVFKQNVDKVTPILIKAVKLIGQQNWDDDIDNLQKLIKEGCMTSEPPAP